MIATRKGRDLKAGGLGGAGLGDDPEAELTGETVVKKELLWRSSSNLREEVASCSDSCSHCNCKPWSSSFSVAPETGGWRPKQEVGEGAAGLKTGNRAAEWWQLEVSEDC